VDVIEDERDIHITAYPNNSPDACPNCSATGELLQFGQRNRHYLDIPIQCKRVNIHVSHQRWRCKACGRTFCETPGEMHPVRRMTKRLVAYIEAEAQNKTLVALADEVGVTEGTIRNICRA
jgi:transposase